MKRTLISLLAAAATCAVAPLLAQDSDGQQYEPGRAVARISVLNGDVSVRRGDSGEVVAAALNAPLMADDRVLTASSSRAEVQLDSANLIRIGANSEVRFSALDLRNSQIQIAAGTVTFRVLRPSQAQIELDTPSVAVRPLRQGIYRITVRDDGTSEVTVRLGEAEVDSQRGGERLQAGQTMNARGPASDPEFQIVQAYPPDSWDRFNDDRDRYLERSQSYQRVSPDIYGAEDLDQYGQWNNDPTYGSVWTPNVAPGWAPYQSGRWVWEDFYGWTWVSNDPWGWAPYHYGRWFNGPVGWSWYPGPIHSRYYWAPAYVGFFGWGGGGVSVGFGFGGVGWVPLAPFEVLHPWWGRGFYGGFRDGFYGNHTTIVNNINVGNVYRNARVAGGVTGVNAGEFGRSGRFTSLNQNQIQQAGLVHGVLPVSPDRSSLRMSDRSVSGNFPQTRAQSFAGGRMQVPRVDHVPFEQQQRGMQQISRTGFVDRGGVGNSGGFGGGGNFRGNPVPGGIGSNSPGSGSPASGSPASGSHGWARFGEPIHGSNPGGSASSPAPPSFDRSQRFENARPEGVAPRSNYAPSQNYGNGGGQPVRISPPIVQQRAPSYEAPRNYQAPAYQSPPTRNYEAPQNYQGPAYQSPRNYEAPRSFGGGGARSAPSYQAPRNFEAPRNYEGPRNFGGGGGGGARSAPSYGGGGGGGARNAPSYGGGGSGGGGYRGGGGGQGGHGGGGDRGGHR
jgi:hypothetical protein